MKPFIGCDLGGTNLRAAIVDVETGNVLHQLSVPTLAREGHDAVMKRMADLFLLVIQSAGLKKTDIGGIGIGVPGVFDPDTGETLFLPNLPGRWPRVPLAATISRLTGLPATILNDVRSITYGEWRFGAGKGVDTLAVLAIGTGIGGGWSLMDNSTLASAVRAANSGTWSSISMVRAAGAATPAASKPLPPAPPSRPWA
jgi:glucokinase